MNSLRFHIPIRPIPLSQCFVNATNHKGRHESKEYAAWKQKADWLCKVAQATPRGDVEYCFDKRVRVTYTITPPAKGCWPDLGNLDKACSDLLQRVRILKNDNLIHHLTLKWAKPEDNLPEGILVEIEEL